MKGNLLKNIVFSVSAVIIAVLAILGAVKPGAFGEVAGYLYRFTTNTFGWFYMLSIFAIIIFLIWVAASKYGTIRLGGDKEKPEYPFFTWIGMLFSAGFGVGLVFWGVAEPMSHFLRRPSEASKHKASKRHAWLWAIPFSLGDKPMVRVCPSRACDCVSAVP